MFHGGDVARHQGFGELEGREVRLDPLQSND
jgi:hypothetical protein